MTESREAVEAFIDYIDWEKSPDGWGTGQLREDAPESAKKAFEEYKESQEEMRKRGIC